MKNTIYVLVTFIILTLDRISVGSGSLLDSLLISAQKTGPPLHCVIAVSNENDPAVWTGSSVPVIHVNVNAGSVNDSIALLKEASKRCPMYIINVESIQDVKDVTETYGSGLTQGSDGRYILLLNKANFSQSKSFLQDNQSFFAKVIHVAVVIKRDSVGNLMLARDPLDESEVTLLDTFGGSKMHDNAPVFPTNRLTNLKGKQLTVTSFNYPPFNYVGSDGEPAGGEYSTMKAVSEALNFTFKIQPPTDGGKWGAQLPDGSFNGLLGDIQRSKTDVGFANLFVLPDEKGYLDFLAPHSNVYVCFIVAKPPPNPKWMDLTFPFGIGTWIATIFTLMASTLFVIGYSLMYPGAECTPGFAAFVLMAVLLCESDPFTHKIKSEGMRFFMVVFILLTFVLTIGYRGSLNAVFTVTVIPQPMDTLTELAKSDLPVGKCFGKTVKDAMSMSTEPHLQKIAGNMFIGCDYMEAFKNTSESKMVLAEAKTSLEYNKRVKYTNKFGESNMHIMKECFISYKVAFAVPTTSVYKTKFDFIIKRLTETGHVLRWFENEMDKAAKVAKNKKSETSAKPLTADQLQAPLMLYPLLILVSLLSFCLELIPKPADKTKVRTIYLTQLDA